MTIITFLLAWDAFAALVAIHVAFKWTMSGHAMAHNVWGLSLMDTPFLLVAVLANAGAGLTRRRARSPRFLLGRRAALAAAVCLLLSPVLEYFWPIRWARGFPTLAFLPASGLFFAFTLISRLAAWNPGLRTSAGRLLRQAGRAARDAARQLVNRLAIPFARPGSLRGRTRIARARATQDGPFLLIGMPCWGVSQPFHALAQVAGIARHAGVPVVIDDINVEFYHAVHDRERVTWNDDRVHIWFGDDLPARLWDEYRAWFEKRLDQAIDAHQPFLVGFSINGTNRVMTTRAAQYIRRRRPDLPILFGGISCFPRERDREFVSPDPCLAACDIIFQGEAEISLPPFLTEVRASGDWRTDLPGFLYYDGHRRVDTGPVCQPSLKEPLPRPAFDLFDLARYTTPGALSFSLSRGCPFSCTFCSESPNFAPYRVRRAEEAFEEFRYLVDFARRSGGSPTIFFSDSILNANMKVLDRFLDLLLDSGLAVRWTGQAHVHAPMTREFLAKMKRAGCVSLFWGIESGSERVLEMMRKRFTLGLARRVIDDCIELGIRQTIPILLGYPGETPREVIETIEFIFRYLDRPGCLIQPPNLVMVRRNAPLHDDSERFELADNAPYDWRTRDGSNTIATRVVRRFLARQAQGNPRLDEPGLVDTEEIQLVDFDRDEVRTEIAGLLDELDRAAGGAGRYILPAIGLNTPDGRRTVQRTMLAALKAFRDTLS